MPERVQLRRAKGWKMPPNTVKVDRTTHYGNPFVVGRDGTSEDCANLFWALMSGMICVSTGASLEDQRAVSKAVGDNMEKMRGKNLACWCRLDKPCHADALLAVFNRSAPPQVPEHE